MGMLSKIFRKDDAAVADGAIQEIAILRSNGELETGWHVDLVLENTVWVSSAGLSKRVPMADVLRANPALVIGRTLRIQRSQGEFESDWQAVSLRDDQHVKLMKPGRAKTVSLEQIVEWNDWGSEFATA